EGGVTVGAVFKKQTTRPLPPGAEVFTRKGDRLARYRDGKGKLHTVPMTWGKDGSDRIVTVSPYYFAKYRDGDDIVRVVPTGCKDEQAARRVLGELERKAELVRAGVMTSAEVAVGKHRTKPIGDHLEGYDQHLRAKGVTRIHRENSLRYLRRLT